MRLLAICILLCLGFATRAMSDRSDLSDLSDVSGWEGLSPDPTITYNGMPAPRWEQAKSGHMRTDQIPHDWVRFNCLEFALHCNNASGKQIMLILASDTPKSPEADYFSKAISLDWTGWKSFTIPFTDFSIVRCPVGFSQIQSIMFTSDGWGLTPDPKTVIRIADLRLGQVPSPGISDAELFEMLDLGRPGLEKVKASVASDDMRAAKHEFADYLRDRQTPVWKWDWRTEPKLASDPTKVDTAAAERVMAHELWSCSHFHKYEGEIDWTLNPINYREWPWQLCRHRDWINLANTYRATGDEKYAQEFVFQLMDWLRKCPVPTDCSGNASYTWRTIEAGIRTGQSWMEVFHKFLVSPSFTDEAVVAMVKSFAEHARHLSQYPTTGNWLAMEMNGLMHVGVMFPEFKEAPKWRDMAIASIYEELDRQVYPDGAQIELATGYHQVSLGNFVSLWDIAHRNNVPAPDDFTAKLQKMYDYNLLASMPGGTLPGLNDSGRSNIKGSLKQALTYYPDRKDYEWVATDGKSGTKPSVGSIALPFSGQLVMRSGWDANDLYLLMDAGPFGYGHQHEDALSFVIYSHGKYHLVDPGNYPYDSSEWRKYVLSTRSHNTIRVDGEDQHRRNKSDRNDYVISKPLPNKWAAGDGFDYASGLYSEGYGPTNEVQVTHARHIFFVKPEYWIVTDFLTPKDGKPHRYDSMFHVDAPSMRVDGKSVVTQNEDSNLAIIPLADDGLSLQVISGQEKPIVQGWMPAGGYDVRPIPTPTYTRESSGPTSFAYVFYPMAQGTECPVASVEKLAVEGTGDAVGLTIRFSDGRTDHFVQAPKAGMKLRFLDFETDGQVVHVSIGGDGVVKASLAGGSKFSRGGEPVKAEAKPVEDLSKTDLRHKF